MHPILFQFGDFPIHTYGFLGAVGFLAVVFIVIRRVNALGLNKDRVVDVIFWGALSGLVGSRVFYVVQNPDQFDSLGQMLNIRGGGLVFYGALVVGLPVGGLLMKRFGLPFFKLMDVFATGFPLGHAITRVGCIAAGCCFGTHTDVPWAVRFRDPTVQTGVPFDTPLHPTQLYEAGWLLIVFGVVSWFYGRKRFDGQVMMLYLVLYAVGRSVIEVFRGDITRGFFLEETLGQVLTFSQGLSILVAAAALGIFLFGARRAQQLPAPAAPADEDAAA